MKRLKKIYPLILLLLIFALTLPTAAATEQTPDVEILLDGSTAPSLTADRAIAVQLDIIFHDTSWYNDHLYLSYHIYDKEGNVLLYEGQRILIENGYGGEVRSFPVALDLNNFEETKKAKDVSVMFDIVDEQNSFWFASSPELMFKSASVVYDGHFPARMKTVLVKAVHRFPILLINILACILFAFGCFTYRRSRDEKILTGPFHQTGERSLDRNLYERYFTSAKYVGRGHMICVGKTSEENAPLLPYTKFFAEELKWEVSEETPETIKQRKAEKIDVCLVAGQDDVVPFLIQLENQKSYPKLICFDFHGTDYDKLMEWNRRNHYRYDTRSFDFVFLKKKNFVERIVY